MSHFLFGFAGFMAGAALGFVIAGLFTSGEPR